MNEAAQFGLLAHDCLRLLPQAGQQGIGPRKLYDFRARFAHFRRHATSPTAGI